MASLEARVKPAHHRVIVLGKGGACEPYSARAKAAPATPVAPGANARSGARQAALNKLDIVLVAIFLLEMFLKIVTLGFALHPGSYMRQGWNLLDGTIALTGAIGVVPKLARKGGTSLSVLRAARHAPLSIAARRWCAGQAPAAPAGCGLAP